MAFASFDSKSSSAPMSEINMVPLIDVMLVLLVIFIVTAPLLTNTVKLDLPRVAALIAACLPTRLHFISYRNDAFDTHVQQVDPRQRMLT